MATLTEHLKAAELREANNVANLLDSGAELKYESDLKADSTALLETYTARAQHLGNLSSHHANRLERSTKEFCDNLANLQSGEPIAYAHVDDTLLGSYILWYIEDTQQPIGCLYVIGKTEVPDEAWEKLWHDE